MITCPICETEHEDPVPSCILCGGDLPQAEPEVAIEEPTPTEVVQEPPPPSSPSHEETPQPLSAAPAFQIDAAPTSPLPQLRPTDASTQPHETAKTAPTGPPQVPNEPPAPGTLCLIVYFQRRPALYFPVMYDEVLIGRQDPASNSYPDLDVTPYDPELAISRKHAYLYREGENYYIYPISNSGTQVNQEMVDIGAKKLLKEGDVVILSGRLAIRFARMPANR